MELLNGVFLSDMTSHRDDRGIFTEVYRESWVEDFRTIQWNIVRSEQGVLRGVHAHRVHYDYLTVVDGEVCFGLHDLREQSPTFKKSCMVTISANKSQTISIPPGVAHGFYFVKSSIHVYGVSAYWNLSDEFGCRFDESELNLDWPDSNPHISTRDEELGTYKELLNVFKKT